MTRYLIINADGYGFTEGTTRAIEECIDFGTVRSISVNVNFRFAERLENLAKQHPELSIGCHVNPVVGPPVLNPGEVRSLLNERGEFLYKDFVRSAVQGKICLSELRAEMKAQIMRTRELAGRQLTHVDFHMGVHRLPRIYDIFLDVAKECGIRRVRTHRYLVGLEHKRPWLIHARFLAGSPRRLLTYVWNLWLQRKAAKKGFVSPHRRVEISGMGKRASSITVDNYISMLEHLPPGYNELVSHPGYVDSALRRYSTYLGQRERELKVLTDERFKLAIYRAGVHLAGYRDIAVNPASR